MLSPVTRPRQTLLQNALAACFTSFSLVFAYSCAYNLLLLAPSIYLLQVYDRVLSSRSLDTLAMLTLIISVAVVTGTLLDVLRRAALSRIGAWLDQRLRPAIVEACFDYAPRAGPQAAADSYRDLTALRQFLESPASALLFDVPWAPLFLVLLFLVHPVLGLLGVVAAALLFCFALLLERMTADPAARAGQAQATGQAHLGMVLANIRTVRAMGMLDGAGRLVCRHAEEARGLQEVALRRTDVIQAFAKSTRAVTQVLMMGAAAWLVLEDQRSPGIIFVSSLLFARGITPLEGAIGAWKAFAWARGAYRRLTDMLVAVAPGPASEPIPLPQPRGGVSVADAGSTHPITGRLALRGISLHLAPGDCLGIIGPSGSGKSTLGRLIAGVAAPTAGNVLLDGIDVSTWRRSGGCRHIGYLPQDIELFGGAVKHIIGRWNGDLRDVMKAAALAGLHETIMQLPQAYDTDIGDGSGYLLRGQRQRLGLARAVFGDPRLVVLDEPNASLDYSGEHMLFEAIERMKAAGTTVVIITHRTGILAATNKIAILQDGVLSAFGDRDTIFERHLQKPQIAQRDGNAGPARSAGPPDKIEAQA